jgi:hypothetical protein
VSRLDWSKVAMSDIPLWAWLLIIIAVLIALNIIVIRRSSKGSRIRACGVSR